MVSRITPNMNRNQICMLDWTEDKSDYIISLYRKYSKELLKAREEQKLFKQRISGWCFFDDIEGEVIYLLVRDLAPKVLVEVSSGNGWSTSWILRAVRDNGVGSLISCDIDPLAVSNLPDDLTSNRWKFLHGDVRLFVKDLPASIDFLLMDSEHTDEFCKWFVPEFFPRVRQGGKIATHDIYALPHPGHADPLALFTYLDKVGLRCYTPAAVFPETFSKIMAIRKEIGIPESDVVFQIGVNSLAIFDVPRVKSKKNG